MKKLVMLCGWCDEVMDDKELGLHTIEEVHDAVRDQLASVSHGICQPCGIELLMEDLKVTKEEAMKILEEEGYLNV